LPNSREPIREKPRSRDYKRIPRMKSGLNSAELFDRGFGICDARRLVISTAPTGFLGDSEASSPVADAAGAVSFEDTNARGGWPDISGQYDGKQELRHDAS